MADLLDVEGTEAEAETLTFAGAGEFGFERLERFEQVEDDPVVDFQRLGGGGLPRGVGRAAFEERVAVRVKEAAAVGREAEFVVLDAAVDGAEGGEQAAPGVVAAFEKFLPVTVGGLPELFPQGGDGVVLVVEVVAEQEQAFFLGAEEEDQPHHDREGGVVEVPFGSVGQKRAAVRGIETIQ